MDSNNEKPQPHNPYAPEPGEPTPNQYGQYSDSDTSSPQQTSPSSTKSTTLTTNIPTSPASTTPPAGATTPSHLNVDVVAPTHFDEQPLASQSPQTQTQTPQPKATNTKAPAKLLPVIVSSVIALVCLIFGIWALYSMLTKDDQLRATEAALATQSSIISALEQQTGTTIASVEDVPDIVALDDYIYINEWGIKLHIPANLVHISFILNQNYRQTICFNGVQADNATFPTFADVRHNPGGMGCLIRVSSSEGDVDSSTNVKFGTKVYSADGYNYFYVAPTAVYSTDPAEQGLENTAVQLIKTMLSSDNISSY